MGKAVKLKLYADPPLVKMVVLGDYLWLQHYHADMDIETMPEYVLRRNRKTHGLYTLYTHYFEQRWENPEIPEYDLETDELVYRSRTGSELRREHFEPTTLPCLEAPVTRTRALPADATQRELRMNDVPELAYGRMKACSE